MRAWAVTTAGEPLEQVSRPDPVPTGAEVVVEVTHCGVCHSDLHTWDGYYDLGGGQRLSLAERGVTLPLVLGHEMAGRVAAVGPDVEGVAVGDLRIVYPWIGCGRCAVCLRGEDHMCEAMRSLGIYQDGGYSTHVTVPHERYLVDPGSVDLSVAATFACSGITVVSAISKLAPLDARDPVVLFGAGGLGLAAIAVLRATGHETIVTVDLSADNRDAALRAGATAVVDGGADDVPAAVVEACGATVGSIIDFVNSGSTARAAHASLRKGGTLVQVGLFGGDLTVALPVMATRATTIRGSFVGSLTDLRALVDLADSGRFTPAPVEVVPLDDANLALERLRSGRVTGRLVLSADAGASAASSTILEKGLA